MSEYLIQQIERTERIKRATLRAIERRAIKIHQLEDEIREKEQKYRKIIRHEDALEHVNQSGSIRVMPEELLKRLIMAHKVMLFNKAHGARALNRRAEQ